MLAGSETVAAEVGAAARKGTRLDIADFHLVGHAAGRFYGEGGEDRVLGVEVDDGMFFVDGALGAAVDLILVGGAPVSCGRDRDGIGLFLFCRFFGGHLIESFEVGLIVVGEDEGFNHDPIFVLERRHVRNS